MGEIRLQMIDSHISSHWWQELVKYFVNVGNSLEIRCWKEESEEIQQALQYSKNDWVHFDGKGRCPGIKRLA